MRLPLLVQTPDMVIVSKNTGAPLKKVAEIFFQVSDFFKIDQMENLARKLQIVDYYDGFALSRAQSSLATAQQLLSAKVLSQKFDSNEFEEWLKLNHQKAERIKDIIEEITNSGNLTVSKFTMAASVLLDHASEQS